MLQWLFYRVRFRLYRYLPTRAANVAGFLLTVFLVFIVSRNGVLDHVLVGLDESVTVAQKLFDTAPPAPAGENMTGAKESLVSWEALGEPGRDYVTRGPDAVDITAFTGRDAPFSLSESMWGEHKETRRSSARKSH